MALKQNEGKLDHLTVVVQTSITLKEAVMELWSLKSLKKVKILYENIEGFLRNSIITLTM